MIDLHTHSHFSDGSLSPTALVDYAASKGITLLALTDHDCVDGIAEANTQANKLGMRLLAGVELSVLWGNTPLHIIGLGLDPTDKGLSSCLATQCQARETRAEGIAERLEAQGVKDALNKTKQMGIHKVITRPHFAQMLVREGRCKDIKSAFKRYLRRGKPAYVRVNWVEMAEGISTIKQAGGIPIIAHPMRYGLTNTKLQCLLGDFKAQGGLGVEVISGFTSDQQIATISALCKSYDLMASIGSDFHGPETTPSVMGQLKSLPKQCRCVVEALDGEYK